MDIASTLTTITAALGLAKELRDINDQVNEAELRLKVAELMTALADARTGLVEVAEQMRSKDGEIEKLRSELAFRSTRLVDKGQWRFFADANGNATGRPICQKCEKRSEYFELVQDRSKGAGGATYFCPGCRSNYGTHIPRA
jgi:DNA-directed RNA polymerase subunit M/transcription elongation factor TFIIS